MKADESFRPPAGRRSLLRAAGAVLAALVVAACAGENLFTFAVTSSQLFGPEVEITAPLPPLTIAPGDSVQVTANLTSDEGISEVTWSGTLEAGGAEAFTPVTVSLAGVLDTTMSRYLKRSGTTAGAANLIVTATDLTGDTGADTVAVTLGS